MYTARHTHRYCTRFHKPAPFLESSFGQVFLGGLVTFAMALIGGLLFFSV